MGWRECPARLVRTGREQILPVKRATTCLLANGWERLSLTSALAIT